MEWVVVNLRPLPHLAGRQPQAQVLDPLGIACLVNVSIDFPGLQVADPLWLVIASEQQPNLGKRSADTDDGEEASGKRRCSESVSSTDEDTDMEDDFEDTLLVEGMDEADIDRYLRKCFERKLPYDDQV